MRFLLLTCLALVGASTFVAAVSTPLKNLDGMAEKIVFLVEINDIDDGPYGGIEFTIKLSDIMNAKSGEALVPLLVKQHDEILEHRVLARQQLGDTIDDVYTVMEEPAEKVIELAGSEEEELGLYCRMLFYGPRKQLEIRFQRYLDIHILQNSTKNAFQDQPFFSSGASLPRDCCILTDDWGVIPFPVDMSDVNVASLINTIFPFMPSKTLPLMSGNPFFSENPDCWPACEWAGNNQGWGDYLRKCFAQSERGRFDTHDLNSSTPSGRYAIAFFAKDQENYWHIKDQKSYGLAVSCEGPEGRTDLLKDGQLLTFSMSHKERSVFFNTPNEIILDCFERMDPFQLLVMMHGAPEVGFLALDALKQMTPRFKQPFAPLDEDVSCATFTSNANVGKICAPETFTLYFEDKNGQPMGTAYAITETAACVSTGCVEDWRLHWHIKEASAQPGEGLSSGAPAHTAASSLSFSVDAGTVYTREGKPRYSPGSKCDDFLGMIRYDDKMPGPVAFRRILRCIAQQQFIADFKNLDPFGTHKTPVKTPVKTVSVATQTSPPPFTAPPSKTPQRRHARRHSF